ncbi:hypothetical protein [Hymenobacter jeollabukensis]|uniref:Uncharacterized protein n=1 Tax=Hymenobacter jeollabukensis TaxID=2025313 RepID=A0A5R8WJC7_9BACT|nr:hypothetical protein [Hymenobacter jeollabukensis]TLM88817.1 hypothetical protein FDY95_23570 [Hymenobacter jeollabukensis]
MSEPAGFNLYEDIAPVFEYLTNRLKRVQEEAQGAGVEQHWQNQHKAIVAMQLGELQMQYYAFRNIYLYHSVEDMKRIQREQEASGDDESRFNGFSIIPHTWEIVNSVVRDGYVHLHHAVEDMFRNFNAHAKNEPYARLGARPRNSIDFVDVFNKEFGFDLSIEGPRLPKKVGGRRGKKAAAKVVMMPGANLLPRLFKKLYPRLDKIRTISNCVKHQGGIPTREHNAELYKHLPNLPERRLLAIDHMEFLQDFDYVLQFAAQFLNFYDDLMAYVLLRRELASGAAQADPTAAQARLATLKSSLTGYATMFKHGTFGDLVTHLQDLVTRQRARALPSAVTAPHGPHENDVRPEELRSDAATS